MNPVDSNLREWWAKTPALLLWASIFYVIWNWGKFAPVWLYGDLQGPDSFLRLFQVQAWLAGQSWFDLTAYQMAPPGGADIHWSRLVDVPIAFLTLLFDLFLETQRAGWLAAIVWPYLLFLAILLVVLRICTLLIENCNPLIVVFFYVFSVSILAETAPGRIDHHNVQIMLFALALLGLIMKPGWQADGLVGVVIPLSLSIGMDSAPLFLPLLALIGVQWAINVPGTSERMLRIGAVMLASGIVIYGGTVPTERWADDRCDAFSLFYLIALINLSVAFVALGLAGRRSAIILQNISVRLAAGALVAAIAVGILFWLFPHCLSGPYGNLDPELHARWLSRVEEAKGIFGAAKTSPQRWLGDFVYVWLVAGLAVWITMRNYHKKPEYVVLLCVILICAVGLLFQIRILRTGIVAAIPVCSAFGMMVLSWLNKKHFELAAARLASLGLICFVLTSFFWFAAGNIIFGRQPVTVSSPIVADDAKPMARASCYGSDSLRLLSGQPAGIVMSDLNTATPIMLHTGHTVIAGPYHRNGSAILSVLDFFETDEATARAIAERYQITHVVFCNRNSVSPASLKGDQLQKRLLRDDLPEWLTWISGKKDRLLVLKVN